MKSNMEKAKILIVDDEVIIAAALESRLKGLGYTVRGKATSGKQALELVGLEKPDLVMLDIDLPGAMDGIEAAEAIQGTWGVPVVFLAAQADADRLERARPAYPFGCLLQPFRDWDLKITVEMALYVARVEAERRRVEEKNEFQAILLDAVGQPVIAADVEGAITYWNKAAEITYGFTRDEVIGRNIVEIIPTDQSREEALEIMNRLAQGESWSGEFNVKRKDGSSFPAYVVDAPVLDNNGELVGIIGVSSDIAERKHAERQLRESEEKYRSLFAEMGQGFALHQIVYDQEGRPSDYITLEINRAFENILGIAKEMVVGKKASQVLPPDEFEKWITIFFKGILTERPFHYEIYSPHNEKHFHGVAYLAQKGRFAVVFEDITERKRAEEALRASEDKYRRLTEDTPACINTFLPDGTLTYVNRALADLAGSTSEALTGRCFFDRLSPEDRVKVESGLAALRPERPVETHEQTHATPDGSPCIVQWTNRAFFDETGRVVSFQAVGIDITERKRAEEALKASEANFRAFFASMQDMILVGTPEGRVLYANDAIIHKLGYSLEEFKSLGVLGVHPRDRRREAEQIFAAILRGERNSCPLPVRRKDDTLMPVETRVFFGKWDGVDCVFAIIKDLTVEQEAQERFERLFRNNPAPMALSSLPDRRFVDINDAFLKVLGYARAEVLGKSSADLGLFPDAEQQKALADRLAAEGRIVDFELKVRAKDGSLRYGLFSGEVVASRQRRYFLTVMVDITERKQEREALRESEEKFSRAFLTSPYAITITRPGDGKFMEVNEAFESITGYTKEEALADSSVGLRLWLSGSDRDEVVTDLLNGKKVLGREFKFRKKSGEAIVGLFSAQIIQLKNEKLILSSINDITERKLAEEEKENLQAQLQQAHKMEAIGTLAGGIAHDFNNLLQAINGYTQLLLMDKSSDNQEYHSLKAIQGAGFRAADLVRQLLLFSRKADSTRRPLDLQYEVEKAKKMLERTIPKMVDIQVTFGTRLWAINADPVQMEQMLLNLGTNAADAMPDGGKLLFELENVTLDDDHASRLLGVQTGEYVLLSVSDTGHGMDKETMENIFDPFFTTKAFGQGTGLGLASVYGIVKSHGGGIACFSEVGRGATFKVYFPAIEQPEPEETIEVESKPIPRGAETILLVDDEEAIRDFAQQALMKFGYNILTASTGEGALEIYSAKSADIDLVVMDLGMPGMGGHKCLLELLQINPLVKIVISSGYSIMGQVKKSIEAGAKGFVGKPYQLADLLTTVRAVLDEEEQL
ncbi:MAG: PAS domain S-box protein [Pseudomonadota bacterium]